MITIDKLKIFIKYNGDADIWARSGGQQHVITGEEWNLIDSLLQDFTIIKNGYASNDFISDFNEKIEKNCDTVETIALLKSLSNGR
jgi:hypothetical protein